MSRSPSRSAGLPPRPVTGSSSSPGSSLPVTRPTTNSGATPQRPPSSPGLPTSRPKTGGGVRELSWSAFDALSLELARGLVRTFEPDAVVGVAKGGVFVGGAVASVLKRDFFPVRISRRSRDQRIYEQPRAYGVMPKELKGKKVLIVDDVAASGQTLELAADLALKVGAAEVRTAALVVKAKGFKPDWSAMESEDLVVFPWDYDFFPGVASSEPVDDPGETER